MKSHQHLGVTVSESYVRRGSYGSREVSPEPYGRSHRESRPGDNQGFLDTAPASRGYSQRESRPGDSQGYLETAPASRGYSQRESRPGDSQGYLETAPAFRSHSQQDSRHDSSQGDPRGRGSRRESRGRGSRREPRRHREPSTSLLNEKGPDGKYKPLAADEKSIPAAPLVHIKGKKSTTFEPSPDDHFDNTSHRYAQRGGEYAPPRVQRPELHSAFEELAPASPFGPPPPASQPRRHESTESELEEQARSGRAKGSKKSEKQKQKKPRNQK